MKQEPGRQQPGIPSLQGGEEVKLDAILDEFEVSDPSVRERVVRLAGLESSGNLNATGPKVNGGMHNGTRARGALQIMPATAKDYPQYDLNDPADATRAGLHYFLDNLNQFSGNLDAATIAHHAGPGTAKKWLKEGKAGTVDRATGLSTDDYLAKIAGGKAAQKAGNWWDAYPDAPTEEASGNWWDQYPDAPAEEPGLIQRGLSAIGDLRKSLQQQTNEFEAQQPQQQSLQSSSPQSRATPPNPLDAGSLSGLAAGMGPVNVRTALTQQQGANPMLVSDEELLSNPGAPKALKAEENRREMDSFKGAYLEGYRKEGEQSRRLEGDDARQFAQQKYDEDFSKGAPTTVRPEASWKDTFNIGATQAGRGMARGFYATLESVGDMVGSAELSQYAGEDRVKQEEAIASSLRAALGKVPKKGFKSIVGDAIPTIISQGAPIAAAALATVATRNPEVGKAIISAGVLAPMGVQSYGNAYADGKQKGLALEDRVTYGVGTALAEVLPERISLGYIMDLLTKPLKAGGKKAAEQSVAKELAKRYFQMQGTELATEEITTVSRFLLDRYYTNPDLTLKDLQEQMIRTALVTPIATTALGAAGAAGTLAGSALNARQSDLASGLQADQRITDAIARQSLDPSNAQMREVAPPDRVQPPQGFDYRQETANVAPPLDAASYQGPSANQEGGAGLASNGGVGGAGAGIATGASARSGEPGMAMGESERQQVAGVVEQTIAQKEAEAAATGDPIELLVTQAEGAALRRAVTPQPTNGIDIDQDALLADVEVMFTEGGNLMVQGENAREAVKRIDPKALASALPRGDGSLLVPQRFAGPVMDALQGAKQRVSVAFGGDGMMQAPDVAQFRATVPTQEEVQDVATQAAETGGQEGEAAADGRVTRDRPMNDGATITDAQGNQYRVHYQRNDLVIAHPIINGKPQVSADTTVRFWTNQDTTPSGDNDRTDPIYPAQQPDQNQSGEGAEMVEPDQVRDATKMITKRKAPARKPDAATTERAQRNAEDLRAMAQDAGWAEEGGRLIRDAEGNASRTKWIPRAEWFMAGMEARPDVLAQHIDAAARGEWIPVKSQRTIEGMTEWLDAQRNQPATLDEDASMYDFEESGYDELSAPARTVVDAFDDIEPMTQQDEAAAMRALGFTEQEIQDAVGQTQTGAGSVSEPVTAGAQEDGAGDQEAGRAQTEAEQEGLTLDTYAPAEIAQREAEQQERADAEAKAERDAAAKQRQEEDRAEVRRRSEAAADTFELGMDPMENLTGQGGLFGQAEPAQQPARTAAPAASANTIFTEDSAEKARALLRRKLGQLNSGVDPEMLQAGITLAGYHIEKGARSFAAYARAMLGDLGDAVRPYLKSWYNALRDYPGFDASGMTEYSDVAAADLQVMFGESGNPGLSKPSPDSISMMAGLFADASQRQSLIEKGFDSLNVAGQRSVITQMRSGIQDDKVFDAIIKAVPVDVVNMLVGEELSANDLLNNKSMLVEALSVPRDSPIPVPVARFIDSVTTFAVGKGALPTTEGSPRSGNFGWAPVGGGSTSNAGDSRQSSSPVGKYSGTYYKQDTQQKQLEDGIQEQGNGTDERGDSGVESDRRDAGAQDGMGEEGLRAEPGRDAAGRGQGVQGARAGGGARRSGELSGREAAPARERGDLTVYTGATDVPGSATRSDLDRRSADPGLDGAPIEPDAAKAVEDAARGGSRLAETRAAQAEADAAPHGNSLEDIRAALPALLPGQQEDVFKAEQRFAKPDGYGMLFTNGTGTGKTFTGLGIVKRFALSGKTNILIVAPNDKIIEDWQKSGRVLGLDIARLQDTNDAGAGIVITTYANFGDNAALASREWGLVVSDESHYLMQDKDGTPTSYLRALRAITLHPDGVYRRHEMLNGDEIAERNRLAADAKMLRTSDDERQWAQAEGVQDRADALSRKLDEKFRALEADIKARQGASRTRAVFLSATPFAYEKTIDWANGYLFDYNESQSSEAGSFRGYNDGSNRDRFFMQHLGYRMRYNKLTQPDAKVDSGLMQRQFNGWLKKKGSLSGRMLDVPFDYDRRFILVDSAIGTRIDAALTWLREEGGRIAEAGGDRRGVDALKFAIDEKFDYLSRRYLLEAIKAAEVIPHVREHLALGRKAVVFHDYKKGGGFNPFVQRRLNEGGDDADAAAARKAYNAALDAFNQQFADLIGSDIAKMPNPIEAFQREFPDVLLFNGNVPKQQRRANVAKFQDDASGPQVILVQSAAGKEGISLHDTTGKHQRVLFNLGQPTQPTTAIQQEGRIYRTGQQSDAIIRYLNTGTNWEKWAFASTIAQRASAAENLGAGEQARALKDAFIQGFEESDAYRAGMEVEGKGGKERDRLANEAISEYDRAKAYYFGQQKKTSKTKAQEGADYFATPEPVGLKMVEWADIRPGERVLEPSAGHGAIARWMPENAERTAIEPSSTLLPRLAMVFDGKIQDATFEALNVVNKFDAIVMNPPFGSGGKTAIEHVAKAATHLREKGRIVALIPTGPAADKRFEKWFYETEERPVRPIVQHDFGTGPIATYRGDTVRSRAAWAPEAIVMRKSESGGLWVKVAGTPGETQITLQSLTGHTNTGPRTETVRPAEGLHLIADIKMPGATFERAGTRVATRIVVIEKQSDPAAAQNLAERQRDYTGVEDIGELFDRLEDLMLPKRTGVVEADAAPATRAEQASDRPKPRTANPNAVGTVERQGLPIVEHTTAKGKVIRGVIRADLSKEQAQKIDPYTWKKDGGYFIREQYLKPEGDAPAMSRASGQEAAPAMTRESLVQSASARFPSLARAVESALRRGDEGKRGGVVVVEDAAKMAEVFAQKTGRTMDDAVQSLGSTDGRGVNGLFDPKSGLTFLFAPNLTAETAPAVLLHEATHGKQRAEIDRKAMDLIETRQARSKPLRDFLLRVEQRMDAAGESGNATEAAAYIVEEAVVAGRQAGFSAVDGKLMNWIDLKFGRRVSDIVRDFVAMVRAWALRKGISFTPTVDDLVAIAKANVQDMARGDVTGGSADGNMQSMSERNRVARITETEAFNGDFDPANPDIRFSRAATLNAPATAAQPAQAAPRAAQAQDTPPDETRFQAFQRKAQDKLNRFTVIKEWLAEQGVVLSEQADVYKAEERMHSRFANKAEDFREKTVKPLVEKIQRAGYSMDDVAQFLHAQHAEERNIQVSSINKNLPDGGSGMKTADANAILAQAPAELKRLANELRQITGRTKQILLDSGIISQDMADAWDATYQNYVPLKGGPEQGGKGAGKGLKANYKGKRALGHLMREEGEWIVENILADHERALMLAEKNRVGQSLLKMAIEVGRDDLLTVGKPEKRGILKNNVAYEVLFKGRVIGSFQSLEAAKTFRATAPAAMKNASPSEFGIRKVSDPTVAYMASPMLADNEVNVYVKGQAIRVQINDELLSRAYGNMGTEALGAILRVGATINGYFSKIYTGYNPEFILTNIVRDFTTGVANVTGEEGAMMALRAAKNYPTSFADLFRYATTGNASQWITMYREDGGNTGAAYLSDLERLGDEISTEYAAYKGVLANLKMGDVKSAARAAGRKAFDKTLVWVERINQAGENAMRLSIYKSMIESGKSRAEAASLAKNATVNFNRNGEVGRQMNAIWLFYNAGVQGTAAIAHANLKGRHKWQARAVSAGILGLGYTMAVALGSDDEDEYDKLSDYTKARNVVFKAGDGWVKIPVPYGYGFFWNMGRAIADAERKGDWGKAPWQVASNFIEEFTPFGAAVAGDELALEQVTLGLLPTLAQIPTTVANNRTTMGGPMYPESSFDKHQPDNEKMWRATKGTTPDMLAQALDQGGIEVSPETIKYLTRTFAGGAGQFVSSIGDAAWLTANGASLEVKEQPFVRKLYTETDVREARSAYYAAVSEAEKAVREGKSLLKMGDYAAYGAYRVENQEFFVLDKMAKAYAKAIKASRDRADAIRADKGLGIKEKREKLKEVEAKEQVLYDRYLEAFRLKTR